MKGASNAMAMGDRVAYYRRRRGLSQTELAGLVARTESWVQKIENGRADLDRLSVIAALATALDIAMTDLLPDDIAEVSAPQHRGRSVPALRRLILQYRNLLPPSQETAALDLDSLRDQVHDTWLAYQSSNFPLVIARLNQLLPAAQSAVARDDASGPKLTAQLAYLFQLAASVLVKVGETDLAGRSAERGHAVAMTIDDPVVLSSLDRSIAHTLLSSGLFEDSLAMTHSSLAAREPETAAEISTAGSLMLVGAVAAARAGSRPEAHALLMYADRAAQALGHDSNHVWTAFGPTNVAIHRVSVAAELGDMKLAAELGPAVDVEMMPRERQVRHKLEVARALSRVARTDEAVELLLGAETLAPAQVRRHFLTHQLVHGWVRNLRRTDQRVVALAQRLGHAA